MNPDPSQGTVLDAPVNASGMVVGAAGTGKSWTLVERVVSLIQRGEVACDQVLVLTPNRQAATRLRDVLGARIAEATPGPLARSVGSFAFGVVRGAAVYTGEEPPELLTGADQDRIIADLLAEGDPVHWPDTLPFVARSTTAFRSDLRAFIAELVELGVTPGELRSAGFPAWNAVGDFVVEYRNVMAGLRTPYRDVPELLAEAGVLLRWGTPEHLGPVARLKVVLVDDAQELTRGGIALVSALRERGVAVLAFGDPDISSGAFRGAAPDLFDELVGVLGSAWVLDVPHRQGPALTSLVRTVTQAIGAAGRVDHRRAPDNAGSATDDRIEAFLAASPHEEFDRIALLLRTWHLGDVIPWEEMAVIAHDTRQVTGLVAELAARDVPTVAAGVQTPLGDEPIVRDILATIRLAHVPAEQRDVEQLTHVLRSPLGGMDAVALRRLRAQIRQRALVEGDTSSGGDLLRQAFAEPASLVLIGTPESVQAQRFAETLVALHDARDNTIHEQLWLVWSRARDRNGRALASNWRSAAAEGSAQAARSLDALVALFDAAKRFVERSPNENAEVFIRETLESEVPEDHLSTPERAGVVTIMTPATALGREFAAVVVAGVQDGIWPNVRLRGGMLDTWRLSDEVLSRRAGDTPHAATTLDRRRAVLHDELRLFVRALSRPRSCLAITAVDDDDNTPSPFFAFLPEPSRDPAEHPITLRGLVARYRRVLTTTLSAPDRAEAAGALRLLAAQRVPGADPLDWYGIRPSSSLAPLHDLTNGPVRMSPSRMENFEKCGLDWVIRRLGGDTRTTSAGLGTILHAAMEKFPVGGLGDILNLVNARWSELEFDAAWLERKEHRWAQLLSNRLDAYLKAVNVSGGTVVGSEIRFQLLIDLPSDGGARVVDARVLREEPDFQKPLPGSSGAQALLSGSIDRMERYTEGAQGPLAPTASASAYQHVESTPIGAPDDSVVIVDLKTGRSEENYSDSKVVDNPQLSAYQLAYASGAVSAPGATQSGGARMVVLSKTLKNTQFRVAHQAAASEQFLAEFTERTARDARGMAADNFIANLDTHCLSDRFAVCTVHTIKPVSAS